MKKTFDVEVCRIAYAYTTIRVEADSPQEAQQVAFNEAGDHTYREKHAEYDPMEVTQVN